MGTIVKRPILSGYTHAHMSQREPLVFHDSIFGGLVHRVPLGGCLTTAHPDDVLGTLLGSCIAACVRDRLTGIGGMNHFLMPRPTGNDMLPPLSAHGQHPYGEDSLNYLVEKLLEQGAHREHLEIKVFGGADVMSTLSGVGQRNIDCVLHFFAQQRQRIAAQDLGGRHSRRVYFHPASGRVWVRRLSPSAAILAHKSPLAAMAAQAPAMQELALDERLSA